jgi:hypothetical protein
LGGDSHALRERERFKKEGFKQEGAQKKRGSDAPVFGSCDERAHVKRPELGPKRVGDIAVDDALCHALCDGCLAHTGLANEHRVVLGAA